MSTSVHLQATFAGVFAQIESSTAEEALWEFGVLQTSLGAPIGLGIEQTVVGNQADPSPLTASESKPGHINEAKAAAARAAASAVLAERAPEADPLETTVIKGAKVKHTPEAAPKPAKGGKPPRAPTSTEEASDAAEPRKEAYAAAEQRVAAKYPPLAERPAHDPATPRPDPATVEKPKVVAHGTTREQVTEALLALAQRAGPKVAKELLVEFKVARAGLLAPEQLGPFVARCEEMV